jgi:hypothetical protein
MDKMWIEWSNHAHIKRLIINYGGGPSRVAARMKVWPSHVQKMIAGLKNPSLKTMTKFSDCFCKPVIVFPVNWNQEKKLEWLNETYEKLIKDV